MPWVRLHSSGNQDVQSSRPGPADLEVAAATPAAKVISSPFRWLFVFSRHGQHPTARQWFYILILNALLPMIISGFLNFGIAYAMYSHETRPIRLWGFPVTMAGDAAVTLVLQCIFTWFMEMLVVRMDLRKGRVQPLAWPAPSLSAASPEGRSSNGNNGPGSRFERWLYMVDPDTAAARVLDRRSTRATRDQGGSSSSEKPCPSRLERCIDMVGFFLAQILRSLILVLPCLVLFWPIPLLVLVRSAGKQSGDDYVFPWTTAPAIFKGVITACQALWITPEYAIFWMTRDSYRSRG